MRFNDERAQKCKWCRDIHGRREPPEEPPCDTQCHIVRLLPENEDVATVFSTCRGQVKTLGMGQVIDIDLQAVKVMCDVLKIGNQADVIARVRWLFMELLQEQKDHKAMPPGIEELNFQQ